LNASKEIGEPNHAGNTGGKSVWWKWTPTTSGQVTFDTATSSFDTVLAAYTGSVVNALTPIASNNNFNNTLQSSVTFAATAGVTYRIAVDGANAGSGAASGSIYLNWTFSPNSAYLDVSGGNFSSSGTVGGPFAPPSTTYTLRNTGGTTLNFSAN